MDYRMTQTGEGQGGAIYPAESRGGRPRVYFDTDDIDGTLAKIRDAGGDPGEKQPIPNIGWFSRCKDSEGNDFSLFQGDQSAPMPEGMGG